MNEDATIKIFSKIQALERDLQWIYQEYFNEQINDSQFMAMIDSTERDIQTHYYIYDLIIQDARKN
jgi:hypothetical protein